MRKQGTVINNEEYIASVLRHKQDPMSFKIMVMNLERGEEYVLDIKHRDLFELTEGCNEVLEREEPTALIDLIVDNLVICHKDGIKVLAC